MNLIFMWSQARAMWLLIWWSLEIYMVINLRAHEISWGTHKLTRTLTLIKKKNLKTPKTFAYNCIIIIIISCTKSYRFMNYCVLSYIILHIGAVYYFEIFILLLHILFFPSYIFFLGGRIELKNKGLKYTSWVT